jgi:tetracycline repressor-like protein
VSRDAIDLVVPQDTRTAGQRGEWRRAEGVQEAIGASWRIISPGATWPTSQIPASRTATAGREVVPVRWLARYEPSATMRVLARFELAFEAARRPELQAAYDEMGRDLRTQAARLLAAAGSAEPEHDAWTLIAWMEGTAFMH